MARIRSTHPGQWTDEDFVSCSVWARLLAIAIRNEADDHGVFEWKPVGIKMRLFPADNIDVAPLLDELLENDQAKRFEAGGKVYGVIRNFCRYQRPKSPTYTHPFPDEFRTYVGLDEPTSEPLPKDFRTTTEIRPQRKEEGGRMEKKEEKKEVEVAQGAPARPEPRGSRLSLESLPPDWREWCRTNTPTLDPDRQWQDFHDYWKAKAGKDGRKADWSLTWHVWCRKSLDKQTGPPAAAKRHGAVDWSQIEVVEVDGKSANC